MGLWIALMILLAVLTAAGIVYLVTRLTRFRLIQRLGRTRWGARGVSFLIILAITAGFYLWMGPWNVAVILLHAVLIWLIAEGVAAVYRKITKRPRRRYAAGAAAILVTVAYLGMGYFCAHHVWRTEYKVITYKEAPYNLKIVGLSDLHAGTTMDAETLSRHIERMNAENADVAVIIGDFVDDSTSLSEMRAACAAVSALQTRYGTYFVFGNHDAGYYDNARRGYNQADLIACLRENGVTVLQDEAVELTDGVWLIGRKDLQRGRAPMTALSDSIPAEGYIIVLDHEPGAYDEEAAADVDLVLSGHTHGGQMIPINKVGEWTGVNDRTYGWEKRQNTDFIVSSGIGDWELQFKTGCISEYIVVNVWTGRQ